MTPLRSSRLPIAYAERSTGLMCAVLRSFGPTFRVHCEREISFRASRYDAMAAALPFGFAKAT
jgi:hypothetical protein